jgi:hypothetical protein
MDNQYQCDTLVQLVKKLMNKNVFVIVKINKKVIAYVSHKQHNHLPSMGQHIDKFLCGSLPDKLLHLHMDQDCKVEHNFGLGNRISVCYRNPHLLGIQPHHN